MDAAVVVVVGAVVQSNMKLLLDVVEVVEEEVLWAVVEFVLSKLKANDAPPKDNGDACGAVAAGDNCNENDDDNDDDVFVDAVIAAADVDAS